MANIETLKVDTFNFAEGSAPSTPSSGQVVVYAKSDHDLYTKDSTGAVYRMKRFHGCRVYRNSAQSISNNSSTAITFDTELFDTDAFHDTGSNTSRITIPSGLDGKYRFSWHAMFAASNTTGLRLAFLRLNGVDDTHNVPGSRNNLNPISASLEAHGTGSCIVDLVATDYIELFVYQNSGGAVNSGTSLAAGRGDVNYLECEFLG